MSGNYLLDTNIVIHFFAQDEDIESRLGKAEKVFLPIIVLGELFFGAFNSKEITSNLDKLLSFASQFELILLDEETSREYGRIKAELRRKGRPIPDNDIWLAALARQYDAVIASRDNHFEFIDNVSWESW
jgi:tRNA(fMet)-specific endonuclease VapC